MKKKRTQSAPGTVGDFLERNKDYKPPQHIKDALKVASEMRSGEKKLAGCVCILHGTFNQIPKCPICAGWRANGASPACDGLNSPGCGAPKKPVRRFVFVSTGNGIGRADEGTDGYTPMPEAGVFPSFEAAQERAMEWNARMGYTPKEAELIAAGTMRGGHLEDRIKKLTALLKRGRELLIVAKSAYNAAATEASTLTPDEKEWADEVAEL